MNVRFVIPKHIESGNYSTIENTAFHELKIFGLILLNGVTFLLYEKNHVI